MTPPRATHVLPAGQWSRETMLTTDTVVLDYDQRHRRRIAMKGARKFEFLLDLAEAVPIRDGDALRLEDGRLILVRAAPEPLAEITAATPAELMRIAWHLGNRHLPTALSPDRIRIRRDHVIEAMVRGLGATVRHIEEAFDPEGGAYAGELASHGHGHGHGHGHHHHEDNPALGHDDRDDEAEALRD